MLVNKIYSKQKMINCVDSIVMAKQQTNNIATNPKSVSSINVISQIKAYNQVLNL